MNPLLKKRLLTQYPEWHQHPLRLSCREMENPYSVFKEFFQSYHLTDIRACLKEWLNETLRPGEVLELDYHIICGHVEKLVEAAWLLHIRQIKKKNKKSK